MKMIDTDKYEGHTPAPWKNVAGDIYANNEHIADTVLEQVIPQDEAYANTFLIADAPLLLEAYKRLREALITVQQSLVWDEKDRAMDGDPITLEALVVQVEQVRSNITEMIE